MLVCALAEVRATFASAAGVRSASCFFETAPGATGTYLTHLKEQRLVVIKANRSTAVEIVAALTLSRACAASTEASRRAVREETPSATRDTGVGTALGGDVRCR